MAAKVEHLLLCASVVTLLVLPCCTAFQSAGARRLLVMPSAIEAPSNDTDDVVSTSIVKKENKSKQRICFQVQDIGVDYNPPEANPDPGNPTPIGD